MALDFSSIGKLFKTVDGKTLGKILKFYSENEDLVDMILALVLNLGTKKEEPRPPSIPDNTPPGVPPGTPTIPPPDPTSGQVYYDLKLKLAFVEENRHGGNRGNIANHARYLQILSPNGPDALDIEERAHFDCTPYDRAGREIRPNDPRHPGIPGDRQNNQYTMDYEWTVDGKVATNSKEMPDPFELESSWDDFGMTPVLKNAQLSHGRVKCTLKMWIKPEYNGGVKLESNVLVFYKN